MPLWSVQEQVEQELPKAYSYKPDFSLLLESLLFFGQELPHFTNMQPFLITCNYFK